jgi:4-hydroxybenzoate polyprenyltransferase
MGLMDSSRVPAVESVEHVSAARASVTVRDYVHLVRPTQWVKNVVVFAGPAAGLSLSSGLAVTQAVLAFVAFCLVASATYAINDVLDREADARHPIKRARPVARGAIRPSAALGVACLLLVAAAVVTTLLLKNAAVAAALALYFIMTLAYSATLKKRVILDVVIIALGFVLRAWVGALAVGVVTSEWLVACVFTLCLFMGFGKRRCEIAMIGDLNEAGQHRRTLLRYTPDLLNHLITVSAGIAVITFLLYTLDTSAHPAPFHKEQLFYTLPLVVYGIFRFAMLTEMGIYSGPTEIVLKDRPLLGAILLWAAVALVIAYQAALFGPGGLEGLYRSP